MAKLHSPHKTNPGLPVIPGIVAGIITSADKLIEAPQNNLDYHRFIIDRSRRDDHWFQPK